MQALGDFCIGTFNEVTFCGNKLASKKKNCLFKSLLLHFYSITPFLLNLFHLKSEINLKSQGYTPLDCKENFISYTLFFLIRNQANRLVLASFLF